MHSTTVTTASTRRILIASLVGTAVEFFDFYIYTTAASLVFGTLFFPSSSTAAQQMAAYASFSIAFVSRPIGSLLFGHFGDRIGRKSTLVASLLTMGAATVAIGFLPTYASVGWLAPLILCLLRFTQGLGLGGEWGGAVLLAFENAPRGYATRYAMFPQLGAPVGFIASNGLFLGLGVMVTADQFENWAWRLPFLASAILVGLGLWVRLRLTETPEFRAASAHAAPPKVPVFELLRDYPRQTIVGTLALVVVFAIFYLSTAFALGYGTSMLHYDRRAFLGVQLFAILFMAAGIVVAGYWADRTSPRHVIMIGCSLTVALGFLMQPLLGSGSLSLVCLFLSLALLTMGIVFGPAGALLANLFPSRVRYTGSSICYNVGGLLGGGFAPVIAQTLAERGGLAYVGIYLGAAGLVSLLALLTIRPSGAMSAAG
jgi:MFS family permease